MYKIKLNKCIITKENEFNLKRLFKTYQFDQVQAYELGWSFTGNPLMTVYCYVFEDIMIDTALTHIQKETLAIISDHSIRSVYLTHYHDDHSGNASAIKKYYKTDVYGHKITIEKMMTPFNIRPYQKYVWGKSKPFPKTKKWKKTH